MNMLQRYERILNISPDTPAEYLIRYRAIWLLGLLFVAMQVFNLITMTANYGRWTYDHDIAVGTSAMVLFLVHLMRWYKGYHVYAFLYSTLVFAGISASALPEHAGINSALLPLLTLGPLITGYISGRLASLLFWMFGSLFILFLYWISISHPSIMANGTYVMEANRATNAFYFLTISAALSTMLTEQTFSAMKKMRQNADRARRAEAAKTDFLAKMSHELRTPLNGVIGLTDALLLRDLPEREAELARTIRHSGESLLQILNDLLDLSKIEAGKMTIKPVPTHIATTIEMAVQGWREAAESRDLDFILDISEDLNRGALLDGLRLRQVIHNLVSNAIKFTVSGSVTVLASGEKRADGEEFLVLRVKDTGVGVSEAAMERIFENFEQGDKAGDRRFGGTGLGLPICRMLTALMGGDILLESSSPAGSTFSVCLPLIPASLPLAGRAEPVIRARTDGLVLLVVEDHKVNQLVIAEFLSILGVHFDLAEDGFECLKRLTTGHYDAVLMDKNMPRMDGVEATKRIRESGAPWKDICIIALTADAMVGEKERLLEAGMDGFLSKPLQISDLADMLSSLPQRSR